MLILSRKVGDVTTLHVEQNDVITSMSIVVIEIRKGRARLGFNAPPNVTILRNEAKVKEKKVL